jgi:hypothetical protein
MIIAAEMEHAMDQQRHEFFLQRPAGRLGLTPSRRHRDDDITQMSGSLIEPMRRSRLSERERQNVRAAILASEPAIELPHSPIAHERESHVCRRLSDERKHGVRQSQDWPASDCDRPDMYLERNGH